MQPAKLSVLLVLYLLAAVVVGSILAYLLAPALDYAYEKVLSRSVLLAAGLGLIPLWRMLGLSASSVGLSMLDGKQMSTAFVLGLLVMLPLMVFFIVIGFRVWDTRVVILSADFFSVCAVIFFSAWLVAIFEETLFRGVLQVGLRRVYGFTITALVVASLYAAVHFLRSDSNLEPTLWGGFAAVSGALGNMLSSSGHLDSFFALFLLGLLFSWVRERFSLWACISLHAVWVMSLRIYKELTVRDVVHPMREWVGEYDNFLGEATAFWLIFCFVVIALRQQWLRGYSGRDQIK